MIELENKNRIAQTDIYFVKETNSYLVRDEEGNEIPLTSKETKKFFSPENQRKLLELTPYFGGKNRVGEWIFPYFPIDIKIYGEVFGGAFWLYFNLKHDFTGCKKILYNDINIFQANLLTCSQNYNRLLQEFKKMFSNGGLLFTNEIPGSQKWISFYKDLYRTYNSNQKTSNFLTQPNKINIPDYYSAALYAFFPKVISSEISCNNKTLLRF